MKVYIVTNIAFPNGMAPASRIKCYAGALSDAGVECEIIVYRRTERYGQAPKNVDGRGMYNGVKFSYIGGTPLRGANKVVRLLDDRKDEFHLLHYLKHNLHKGDVILMYAGLAVQYSVKVCRLAHLKGAKFAYELCELPYGTGAETGRTISKRHKVEKSLLPIVDCVLPISDALAEYASKFVSGSCRICKIPIMVDYDGYSIKDRSSDAEYPYIFHSGKLQDQKDGVLGMFEAFGRFCRKFDVSLKLVTTGYPDQSAEKEKINEIVEKYSLQDKLIFVGYLNSAQIKDYLSKAMMVLSYRYDNQQIRYGFSTKLGEYMAAGKPVIITRVGEPVNWLHPGEDCLMVEPGDEDALVENIFRLFNDSELRRHIGENARRTCKASFDYRRYGDVLKKVFCSL